MQQKVPEFEACIALSKDCRPLYFLPSQVNRIRMKLNKRLDSAYQTVGALFKTKITETDV